MRRTKIIVGVLVVLLILLVVGFSNRFQPAKGFNVGLISILSGDYAAVGENFKNGVVLANELYNTAHPDAQINLSIEDDGFSGGKGVNAYQKLVGVNKVDALINVSTPTIDSIYDTVTKTNMPVIQCGEQGNEPVDDNVFGIYPSTVDSEYDYGVYMRNKGVKEMALVYTNVDGMLRFVEAFKKGFQGKTTDFKISADEKGFRTHALKVTEIKPTTVGVFMFPQQGAQFMKELLKVEKNKPQFFFDANFQSGYTDYKRITGDLTVLDGSIIGSMNIPTSDEFKKAYKARYGTDAGFLADIGYDAFSVLATTYKFNQSQWLQGIKKISLVGASGKTEFGPTGTRKPDTKMMVVKGGEISEIK